MLRKIAIGWFLVNVVFLVMLLIRTRKEDPEFPCQDNGDCLSCTNQEYCAEL